MPRPTRGFLKGLPVSVELDVFGLIALLISLIALGLQGWQYYRGALVHLHVGERVNIVFRTLATNDDEVPVLVVNASMNYTNTGAVGRDAVITRERLEIVFPNVTDEPNVTYEYFWFHFEIYVANEEYGGKPLPKDQIPAHDFIVPGGSAESHQTTFAGLNYPTPLNSKVNSDSISLPDFKTLIYNNEKITLRFFVDSLDGEVQPHPVSCDLALTPAVLRNLRETDWATAFCEEIALRDE